MCVTLVIYQESLQCLFSSVKISLNQSIFDINDLLVMQSNRKFMRLTFIMLWTFFLNFSMKTA